MRVRGRQQCWSRRRMGCGCGMRGVGGVCEMCMCLARGGVVG